MNGVAEEDIAKEILEEALEIRKRLSEANEEVPRPPLALSKPLSPSWISLGEEILRTYHYIETSDAPIVSLIFRIAIFFLYAKCAWSVIFA
jgi:hypothetical protein